MTDADVARLKAYLFAQPAGAQPNRAHDASVPASWRCCERAWTPLFFDAATPMPARDDPIRKTPSWNRGAYLVAAIGALRRVPHAAQPARRDRYAAGFSPGTPAGPDGKQGAEHHPGPENRHRQLERPTISSRADRRARRPNFDDVGGCMAEIVKNTAQADRGGSPRDRSLSAIGPGVNASAEKSRTIEMSRVSALDARCATPYDAMSAQHHPRGGADLREREIERPVHDAAAATLLCRRACRPGAGGQGAGVGARAIRKSLARFDRIALVLSGGGAPRRIPGRGIRRARTFRRAAELDRRHRDRRDQRRDHRRQPAA